MKLKDRKPKHVVVVGRRIKVYESPSADLDGAFGTYSTATAELVISPTISEERKKATFMHEVVHAIFQIMAVPDDDEATVSRVANGFLAFLRDNPDWVRWVQEVR